MLIKINDIEIFIDNDFNLTENQVKKIFTPIIEIGKKIPVDFFDIEIEDNDTTYIYLNKKQNDINEWDKETIIFVDLLTDANYSVLLADEYYGDNLDVIILYDIV